LRDKLQKKADKRKQLHRAQIPETILKKYPLTDRHGTYSQEGTEVADMLSPPKRERGCRGKASLKHVTAYIKAHHMDRLGFNVESVTFHHHNDLTGNKYYPPVPSAVLRHVDRQLADSTVSRIMRRRLQRVLQKIPIAAVLVVDSSATTPTKLGIVKTMHIEHMVSTIDRGPSS
jgi:hypothetical protein